MLLGTTVLEDVTSLAEAAATAELMLSSPEASPERKKLKAAVAAGIFGSGATVAKKALVGKKLSLGTAASPAKGAEAAGAKSSKKAPANASAKAAAKKRKTNDSSDDSDSEASTDDESDEEPQAKANRSQAVAKKARFTAAPEAPPDAEIGTAGALAVLAKLTPASGDQLETARALFSSERVRQLADVDQFPLEVPDADRRRVVVRYSMATDRLVAAVGSDWVPRQRVTTEDEMFEAVERADVACRRQGKRPASDALDSGALANKASKPLDALSAEKQTSAVASAVAVRLHDAEPRLNPDGSGALARDAARCIGEAPSALRADLQRAAMSNGHVDAQGELRITHRTLPPFAHALRGRVVKLVANALKEVPKADATQRATLGSADATKLAEATATATATYSLFAGVAKTMLGDGASADKSMEAVSEAWSLMQPALTTMCHAVGIEHGYVRTIGNRLTAPAALRQVPSGALVGWLDRVLNHFQQQVIEFREGDSTAPSLQAAYEAREEYWRTQVTLALQSNGDGGRRPPRERGRYTQEEKKAWKQQQQQQQQSQWQPQQQGKGGKGDKGGKGGKGDGQPPGRASAAAWAEKRTNIPEPAFSALRSELGKVFPGYCSMYLVATCSQPNCSRGQHGPRPATFLQELEKLKYKPNGEVSSQPTHTRPAQQSHSRVAHTLAAARLEPSTASSTPIAERQPTDRGGSPASRARHRTGSPGGVEQQPSSLRVGSPGSVEEQPSNLRIGSPDSVERSKDLRAGSPERVECPSPAASSAFAEADIGLGSPESSTSPPPQ